MDLTYLLLVDAYILIIAVFVLSYFLIKDILKKE